MERAVEADARGGRGRRGLGHGIGREQQQGEQGERQPGQERKLQQWRRRRHAERPAQHRGRALARARGCCCRLILSLVRHDMVRFLCSAARRGSLVVFGTLGFALVTALWYGPIRSHGVLRRAKASCALFFFLFFFFSLSLSLFSLSLFLPLLLFLSTFLLPLPLHFYLSLHVFTSVSLYIYLHLLTFSTMFLPVSLYLYLHLLDTFISVLFSFPLCQRTLDWSIDGRPTLCTGGTDKMEGLGSLLGGVSFTDAYGRGSFWAGVRFMIIISGWAKQTKKRSKTCILPSVYTSARAGVDTKHV
jgi:hypothetical protein